MPARVRNVAFIVGKKKEGMKDPILDTEKLTLLRKHIAKYETNKKYVHKEHNHP